MRLHRLPDTRQQHTLAKRTQVCKNELQLRNAQQIDQHGVGMARRPWMRGVQLRKRHSRQRRSRLQGHSSFRSCNRRRRDKIRNLRATTRTWRWGGSSTGCLIPALLAHHIPNSEKSEILLGKSKLKLFQSFLRCNDLQCGGRYSMHPRLTDFPSVAARRSPSFQHALHPRLESQSPPKQRAKSSPALLQRSCHKALSVRKSR
jgi:hypothetical protein